MGNSNRAIINLGSIPLWDALFTTKKLRLIKKQTPRMFARGFQQKEIVDDELSFPSFAKCRQPNKVQELYSPDWLYFAGVDLSSAKRPGNVIVTLAYSQKTGEKIPVEIIFSAGKSNEIALLLSNLDIKYNYELITVENNAYQQAILDWALAYHKGMRYTSKLKSYTTTSRKLDPELGLPSLENEFSNGLWVIPYGEYMAHDAACNCAWCRWDTEMTLHPAYTTNDGVMATWFARQGIVIWQGRKQNTFQFDFDESITVDDSQKHKKLDKNDPMRANFGIPSISSMGYEEIEPDDLEDL